MRITSSGQREMAPGDIDQRTRVSVFLVAAERPRYFTFYCMRCGTKVCEVSGDIVYVSDVDDIGVNHRPTVVRCRGRFCRTFYQIDELS